MATVGKAWWATAGFCHAIPNRNPKPIPNPMLALILTVRPNLNPQP